MNGYLPQKQQERELTDKQQKFLGYLIQTGGDPKEAAELAGYAEGSYFQVIKSLKRFGKIFSGKIIEAEESD